MTGSLIRAWEVCRVLDQSANANPEDGVARALALSAHTDRERRIVARRLNMNRLIAMGKGA